MKHLKLTPKEFCSATDACQEGREFAEKYNTMAEVWDACPRANWLLWILTTIDAPVDYKIERLFAVWCARNTPMQDGRTTGALLTDPRSIAALEVAERFAHGNATTEELAAARAAAWAAAWDAAGDAAGAAAWAAAWAAAGDAPRAAARDVAGAAAGAAAWAAAWAAAGDAPRAAARDVAGAAAWAAAWDAARAAAGDAAWAAAWAAELGAAWDATRDAAWAAARDAAGAAAWPAARAAQTNQLRTMVNNPFKEGAK
jgi:hypothetical protein